jgi:hypothetical protein
MKTFSERMNVSESRIIEIFEEINKLPEPGFISIGETYNLYKPFLKNENEKRMFYTYVIEACFFGKELINYKQN